MRAGWRQRTKRRSWSRWAGRRPLRTGPRAPSRYAAYSPPPPPPTLYTQTRALPSKPALRLPSAAFAHIPPTLPSEADFQATLSQVLFRPAHLFASHQTHLTLCVVATGWGGAVVGGRVARVHAGVPGQGAAAAAGVAHPGAPRAQRGYRAARSVPLVAFGSLSDFCRGREFGNGEALPLALSELV